MKEMNFDSLLARASEGLRRPEPVDLTLKSGFGILTTIDDRFTFLAVKRDNLIWVTILWQKDAPEGFWHRIAAHGQGNYPRLCREILLVKFLSPEVMVHFGPPDLTAETEGTLKGDIFGHRSFYVYPHLADFNMSELPEAISFPYDSASHDLWLMSTNRKSAKVSSVFGDFNYCSTEVELFRNPNQKEVTS